MIFPLLIVLGLLLSSCGTTDGTSYIEEPATDVSAIEAASVNPAATSALGEVVYDLGFTPERDEFSFENYGDETSSVNLTANELRRMFGDQVCSRLDGDVCTLTPPA